MALAGRRWVSVAWLRGRDALDVWLDALFPPRCAGCGRPGAHYCGACIAAVKPIRPPWCAGCGRSLPAPSSPPAALPGNRSSRLPGARCITCQVRPLPLAALRSAGEFDGPLRTAIHRLKYRGRRSAARALSDLLVAPALALCTTWPAPASASAAGPSPAGASPDDTRPARTAPTGAGILVVPVPLHPRRARERGYNQAALLAAPLAQVMGWPLDARALRRVKDTAPLVRMSEVQRAAAIAGAFAAVRSLEREHILLVDDVATTGSTLAAAARACLAAGAASVAALTLAREP